MRVNQPQVAAWLLEQFGDPRMAQRALEAKLSGAELARPEGGLKDAGESFGLVSVLGESVAGGTLAQSQTVV